MSEENLKNNSEVLEVLKRLNELGVKAEILDEDFQPDEKGGYKYFFGISVNNGEEGNKN